MSDQSFLNNQRTVHRVGNTWKLHDPNVAQPFHHATAASLYLRFKQRAPQFTQGVKRPLLVFAHEPGVTHYVSGEDSRETAIGRSRHAR